jgi:hypothetical protein
VCHCHAAVGIVVYVFSVLSSLSSTVAVVAFFYYSCLFAVVVHIAVITVIAVIVIAVLLPLLPLSFVIYAFHSSAGSYIEIPGLCLNERGVPAVGPVKWFPTQLEVRLSCLTQSSAFGVVVVGAVVGAEFPAIVNEAFSVPVLIHG